MFYVASSEEQTAIQNSIHKIMIKNKEKMMDKKKRQNDGLD